MVLYFPLLWFKTIISVLSMKKEDILSWEFIVHIIKIIILCLVFTLISQELVVLNNTWIEKTNEYNDKVIEYNQHKCENMKTTNTLIQDECTRLRIIISQSPFTRAIKKVVYNWNYCITMPCNELVYKVTNSYEYKILFIIVSFGVIYYLYKLFKRMKQRYIIIQDSIREKITNQYLRHKQQNNFSNNTKNS